MKGQKFKFIDLEGAICTNQVHRKFVKVRLQDLDDGTVAIRFLDENGMYHQGYLIVNRTDIVRLIGETLKEKNDEQSQ